MTKFKSLLIKIASLPKSDQRWLLKQLSSEQQELFNQYQGRNLLKEARRFSQLPLPAIKESEVLPQLAQELKTYQPLFIAIILEQGQFAWKEELCLDSLPHDLQHIKEASKQALFNQWQSTLSFSEQLEVEHG